MFLIVFNDYYPHKLDTFKKRIINHRERRKIMDNQDTPVTNVQGTTAPAAQAPVEGKKHKKNKKAM